LDWTVLKMLEWGTTYFQSHGIPSPRLSIEWLLAEVLHLKRLDLYLQFDRPLRQQELDQLRDWVRRRKQYEPLQYITGSTEFYDCTLKVNPDVLIPRPETELMVDLLLKRHTEDSLKILDVGTGSGCIAIALKKARPKWELVAVDISEAALKTAQQNAKLNQVEIDFRHVDAFALTSDLAAESFDIIVSNPPYIPPNEFEDIDQEVKAYEPHLALFHSNPESLYQAMIDFAVLSGAREGYFEIHFDAAEHLSQVIQIPRGSLNFEYDLAGKKRFLIFSRNP
jgi:release factor glutamine methyltransferase